MSYSLYEKTQPTTLQAAVKFLLVELKPEDREYIKENGLAGAHHFFGMGLRNGWNLWGTREDIPKDLHNHFKEVYGLGHADDMSGMIFDALEKIIQGDGKFSEGDAVAKAKYYQDYWRKKGVDPLTQKEIAGREL